MDKLFYDISKAFGVDREISEVKAVIREYIEKKHICIYEDEVGNLIVKLGTGNKKLLMSALMNRCGYMAVKIDNEESGKVEINGTNIEPKLDGKYLRTKGGAIARIHDGDKIDILVGQIQAGEFLMIDEEIRVFDNKVSGVEVSNISLIYSLIKVIEEVNIKDKEVYFVFSYKEDSIFKSNFAAKAIRPDRALFFDSSQNSDKLQLIYMNRKYLANESFKQDILNIAKENDIDITLKDCIDETEADSIHKEVGGIATVVLGLPCKYKNTSLQIIERVAIEEMRKLLKEIIEG
ncbi:peptidase M42 [Clostridium cellulovorans]|uniref:Peptidase M42 family protein n=2 Tax=Clostridium cellulovorans TaxID=1493 RepID=D9SMS6_CLOC7|nr:peptidase M42 [Clostridium cellulovorans]ADL49861.1 peptidase M42 family protein [Clostridium cellulovorans 743B]BAV13073.1 aminopeptidase M42 family endoglucanase [Clostridium cellulovorans]